MKTHRIISLATVLLTGFALLGCQAEKPIGEARAVAAGEEVLSFEAVKAEAQTLPIYADGDWAVDVDSDWISVEPMRGRGMGSVTVSVSDNLKGGVQNVPRQGKIIIQGGNTERRGSVIVKQKGDTYYGVATKTLAEIRELDDEAVAKIASAKVAALTTEGFLLSDDSGFLYVLGKKDVKIGDNVSLNGKKVTFHSNPAFESDGLSVAGSGEYSYPAAADLTAAISSYDGKSIVYGKLSGSIINGNMKLGGATIIILNPVAALEIEKFDLHKVELSGFVIGAEKTTGYFIATAVEDKGADESLVPYPLKWAIGKDGINYSSSTFTKDSPRIDPIQGVGYIEYVPFDLEHTNSGGNYNLDVNANNPRVTGPWVNDYWLFYGNGEIKAGTEVKIAFEMRSSKWGMKYWLLEYLDGEEWLVAGEPSTDNAPGYDVLYTVATDENNTNQPVDQIIKFRKNNDHLQIRLRCSALWRGGGGTTESRSTASSRLTITNPDDPTYQPSIIILKEGNGIEKDPTFADIQLSTDLLTFNGTPDAPKELVITSDYDFSLSSDTDWLSFDKTEGLAGEETTIAVTCAPSELSELRQGLIKIVSEDSEKFVNVVQSAAGQQLDPFISLSSGNKIGVGYKEGTFTVRVQTNTDVQVEPTVPWLSAEAAPGTKGMVEWKEYTVSYEANPSEDTGRDGGIRFYNSEYNLEAFLSVSQGFYIPSGKVWFNDDFEWLAPYIAAYKLAKPSDAEKLDPVGSNLASHAQPNLWNDQTNFKPVTDDLYARGYEDLNKSAKTLYMQENYFKMGATNKHTGLRLPGNNYGGDFSSDIILTFDWCAHMTGAGAIDNVTISVIVEGAGFCADSGKAESNPISTTQETGKLAWQHASVNIKGVTKATRIVIRPTKMFAEGAPSQQRWHLDNIKIVAE